MAWSPGCIHGQTKAGGTLVSPTARARPTLPANPLLVKLALAHVWLGICVRVLALQDLHMDPTLLPAHHQVLPDNSVSLPIWDTSPEQRRSDDNIAPICSFNLPLLGNNYTLPSMLLLSCTKTLQQHSAFTHSPTPPLKQSAWIRTHVEYCD